MKHKYHGIAYELIANEFWVEAETYEEAKEKLDSYDAEFGDAEQADSFIQLYSIEVIEERVITKIIIQAINKHGKLHKHFLTCLMPNFILRLMYVLPMRQQSVTATIHKPLTVYLLSGVVFVI